MSASDANLLEAYPQPTVINLAHALQYAE